MKHPYIVIGGGIIGSAIAKEIRKRDLGDVIVLEKENELGKHASGRNSGVIHSGINQIPGTLKAKLCAEGSGMLREYCKEHGVPFEECGTIVIARNEEEENRLETLLENGRANGVKGLRIIKRRELEKREPLIQAKKALLSPSGAIVDSLNLVNTIASEAKSLGAEYKLGHEVFSIRENRTITNNGEFEFGHLINCAGLYADKIARMFDIAQDLTIIPFRGDYYQVNFKEDRINSMVYAPPNLKYPFLGVHLTKSIDGKILAGPTATLTLSGRESYDEGFFSFKGLIYNILYSRNFRNLIKDKEFRKLAKENWKISLFKRAFVKEVNKMLREEEQITERSIEKYRSGIRAQLVNSNGEMIHKFLVEKTENSTHILNAISPGMTSSLAFAEYVVDKYIER